MAIAWSCSCGMTFSTAPESAGQKILCPRCGAVNQVPLESSSTQIKPASSPYAVMDLSVDDFVPEVVPEDEEYIPEVDVEEHGPAEMGEAPAVVLADDDEASYTKNQRVAGNHAWGLIGTVKLTDVAECVAYGPGAAYGVASQDDDILVLNMQKGKKLDRYGGHEGRVTTLTISLTNELVISGDEEGDVLFWEAPTRKRVARFQVHENVVTCSAIAPNLDYAATGDRGGETMLWNLTSKKEERLRESEWPEKVTALTFSPGGSLLAAGGSKGRVTVWSAKTGAVVQRFRVPQQTITSLAFTVKNETVVAAAKPTPANIPTHAKVWRLDMKSAQVQECFFPAGNARTFPYFTQLAHGGRRLLSAGRAKGDIEFRKGTNILEVWSLITGQRLHAFTKVNGDVASMAIAPGNTRLVVGHTRRQLQVFAMPERDTA